MPELSNRWQEACTPPRVDRKPRGTRAEERVTANGGREARIGAGCRPWQSIGGITWQGPARAAPVVDAGRESTGGGSRGEERKNVLTRRDPLHLRPADCVPWTENAVNHAAPKSRLLLWVDAVGGFFVCLGNEIRLGQAVPDSEVDLPLLADLSRHHATIRRDEEGYMIEPVRDVRLNHQRITSASWINDGSLLELGPALKLRFSRPHPLSATARLDYVTHHRTQPSSSAVLLMADTLILGPGGEQSRGVPALAARRGAASAARRPVLHQQHAAGSRRPTLRSVRHRSN